MKLLAYLTFLIANPFIALTAPMNTNLVCRENNEIPLFQFEAHDVDSDNNHMSFLIKSQSCTSDNMPKKCLKYQRSISDILIPIQSDSEQCNIVHDFNIHLYDKQNLTVPISIHHTELTEDQINFSATNVIRISRMDKRKHLRKRKDKSLDGYNLVVQGHYALECLTNEFDGKIYFITFHNEICDPPESTTISLGLYENIDEIIRKFHNIPQQSPGYYMVSPPYYPGHYPLL